MKKFYKSLLFIVLGLLVVLSFGCKKQKTEEKPQEKTPTKTATIVNPTTKTPTPTPQPTPVEEFTFSDLSKLLDEINGKFASYEFDFKVTKEDDVVYYNNVQAKRTDKNFEVVSFTRILDTINEETTGEFKETTENYNDSLDKKLITLELKEEYLEDVTALLKGEKCNLTEAGQIALTDYLYDVATIQITLNEDKLISVILIECSYAGYNYVLETTLSY